MILTVAKSTVNVGSIFLNLKICFNANDCKQKKPKKKLTLICRVDNLCSRWHTKRNNQLQ